MVRRFALDVTGGESGFDWDGRDEYGATAATGVYFARVSSRGYEATARIVILK